MCVFLLLLLHTRSYVYLSLKKWSPALQTNNNRQQRYVAAQSLAVIHLDRTPTTTCLYSPFFFSLTPLCVCVFFLLTYTFVLLFVRSFVCVCLCFLSRPSDGRHVWRVSRTVSIIIREEEEAARQADSRVCVWCWEQATKCLICTLPFSHSRQLTPLAWIDFCVCEKERVDDCGGVWGCACCLFLLHKRRFPWTTYKWAK